MSRWAVSMSEMISPVKSLFFSNAIWEHSVTVFNSSVELNLLSTIKPNCSKLLTETNSHNFTNSMKWDYLCESIRSQQQILASNVCRSDPVVGSLTANVFENVFVPAQADVAISTSTKSRHALRAGGAFVLALEGDIDLDLQSISGKSTRKCVRQGQTIYIPSEYYGIISGPDGAVSIAALIRLNCSMLTWGELIVSLLLPRDATDLDKDALRAILRGESKERVTTLRDLLPHRDQLFNSLEVPRDLLLIFSRQVRTLCAALIRDGLISTSVGGISLPSRLRSLGELPSDDLNAIVEDQLQSVICRAAIKMSPSLADREIIPSLKSLAILSSSSPTETGDLLIQRSTKWCLLQRGSSKVFTISPHSSGDEIRLAVIQVESLETCSQILKLVDRRVRIASVPGWRRRQGEVIALVGELARMGLVRVTRE